MMRILILFLLLSHPLQAEEFPALFAVTGVADDDVLNIRARPDAGSPIIGSLAPDATGVEVIATRGNWALVNGGEGSGYASMRFLTREPGPAWNALQAPLICRGTEPFWSLEIDPQSRATRFLTPEDQAPAPESMTGVWPAEPWARSAAIGLPDGLAVLTGAECSDGMSDRSYGIVVDIFRTGPADERRLSGCCLLARP
ncbi:COG3650 family protein [Tabrizicola sp.]|uniref:COG3650 family protein n=1 Tax=Tabrizicola sp. TaxID=2005166 RepID=UPI002735CC96|nr:SH3 domain-containing protein [Tabrizicola sp.]MDP3197487.1 SH3 domain-containing protein [Tabrizicola sp.]